MAIAFYAEDTKLPAIKKRAVGNWVKEVAATYGKKVVCRLIQSFATCRY